MTEGEDVPEKVEYSEAQLSTIGVDLELRILLSFNREKNKKPKTPSKFRETSLIAPEKSK
ncbi:MAG: hypothetical protein PHV51_06900 [Methanosarcinaceae archaeon]|nr:hypothetical protein [Methanosarcinaceae archaeon]MDD4497861.1 hypothetical protein [Methanosarcinaceae archaeon]